MRLQIILTDIIILIGICHYVQTVPILEENFFNNTNRSRSQSKPLLCYSHDQCSKNSRCHQNKCECKQGWITLYRNQQCSYKQIPKSFTFFISLFLGGAGMDWFILSRNNNLYILTGLLKFLVSIAACIWNRLALISRTETSMIVAGCFGITLSFISLIWWFTDWMRVLLNNFSDGNGVPLIF